MFETLESRRLLTVVLDHGALRVIGTSNEDHLFVGRHEGEVGVNDNGTLYHFPIQLVREIGIRGLDGNDRIEIGGGLFQPLTVSGGGGNDGIRGGTGNERLFGDAGDDHIFGGPGNDQIDAGANNDFVDGGLGHDRILLGAGNDRVNIRDGAEDFVDGGEGEDGARVDRFDHTINVEHVDDGSTSVEGTGADGASGDSADQPDAGAVIDQALSYGASDTVAVESLA